MVKKLILKNGTLITYLKLFKNSSENMPISVVTYQPEVRSVAHTHRGTFTPRMLHRIDIYKFCSNVFPEVIFYRFRILILKL